MPTCVFKTDEVRRCVEHALNSTSWGMGWSDAPPGPAVFFVHDQGVYLMSNGEPRDLTINPRTPTAQPTSYCAYAAQCNPSTDEDWWDNSNDLVGGDDFAETLPITSEWLANCGRYEELHITVNGGELEITFDRPRRIVRV